MTAGNKALFLDFDGGTRVGKFLDDTWKEKRLELYANDNALIKDCSEQDPFKAFAFKRAQAYVKTIYDDCKAGKFAPRVIVIDSLTSMSEFAMRLVLSNNGILGKKPEIQHWPDRDVMMKEMFITLNSLPIAVIMNAHQQVDEIDGAPQVSPFCQGKALPIWLATQFDEILYSKILLGNNDKHEYVINTFPTACIKLRSRSCLKGPIDMKIGMEGFLKLMDYEL
jgi:hypothetical protein